MSDADKGDSLPELERSARETRRRIDSTLQALEQRAYYEGRELSFGLLEDAAQAVWRQAAAHPLPVLTVAAGLAWLAASQTSSGKPRLQPATREATCDPLAAATLGAVAGVALGLLTRRGG